MTGAPAEETYRRRTARVLLVDDADRVLLFRWPLRDGPASHCWITPGGGVEPGETLHAAAVRELREETGITLAPDELVGPVYTRQALFDFFARWCRQDEELFLARVDSAALQPLSQDEWTDVEAQVLDELRWWHLDHLASVDVEVFPAGLADLVRPLLTGWDGQTRHLGLARET